MATSYGPGPALLPPPTPDSLVNKAALAGLVFSTDPKKFRTYTLQFKSAIGAQYKVTLERAIATSDFGPTSTAAIVLHTAIYNMLVLTFKGEDDILDEMIAQCNADGPACFAYLESKYNSTSLPAAVKNLGAIVREPIVGPEQIAGVVALNKRYSRLCFTDEQLTALIILKLPDKYSTIKTLILQSDRLPTVAELMHKLQAEVDFEPDSDTPAVFSAVAGQQPAGFCFNCESATRSATRSAAARRPRSPAASVATRGTWTSTAGSGTTSRCRPTSPTTRSGSSRTSVSPTRRPRPPPWRRRRPSPLARISLPRRR